MPLKKIVTQLSNDALSKIWGGDFDSFRSGFSPGVVPTGDGIAAISSMLEQVLLEFWYVYSLTKVKLKYIYKAADSSVEDENYIAVAYSARAIMEHVATFSYVLAKTESAVSELNGQSSYEKQKTSLRKLNKFYSAFYYGGGSKDTRGHGVNKPIHVGGSIRSLNDRFGNLEADADEEAYNPLYHGTMTEEDAVAWYGIYFSYPPSNGVVKNDYDLLCDFVHPNYGSNFLVSSGSLASGSLGIKTAESERLNKLFLQKCLRYWLYFEDMEKSCIGSCERLYSWLQRAKKKGAKSSKVFSIKPPKWLGDGASVQTAYYFPSARDRQEEGEMFLALLTTLGGEAGGYNQAVASMDPPVITDKITLPSGRSFFVAFMKPLPGV